MTDKRRPALVTGGGRGLGRGIAYALAASGWDVAVVDLAEDDAARETLAGLRARGAAAHFVRGDIADLTRHEAVLNAVHAALGPIDCLVNNAGVQVQKRGDLLDVTPESYDRVMGINLRGTFFLTQAVARRMIADSQAADSKPRSIITISSANAVIVGPNRPEYCFSKTALSMMTKLFALRLAPHRIYTYEVRPGVMQTDMTAPAKERYDRLIGEGLTPIARWGQPEDVGQVVASLAAGAMPFSTGDAYHIDGGLHIQAL